MVKVFPSISSTWTDASIASHRTQGAFLVDASRSGGRTDWVRVRSEAGEPLVLQHGITAPSMCGTSGDGGCGGGPGATAGSR